jgi:choline kinase
MARLILLAAGMGRRMEGSEGDIPKTLVPLASGVPLLVETLLSARASGLVDSATVVTGYLAESVEAEVTRRIPNGFVDAVFNPFFATAGPLGSVWAVRNLLRQADTLLANGDTLFTPTVFEELTERPEGLSLVYSQRPVSPDDVKVVVGCDGRLEQVGKDIPPASAHGASAGLLVIRGRTARDSFVGCLEELMRNGRGSAPGAIWHNIVNELSGRGGGVSVVQVPAEAWHEVDTPSDLDLLRRNGSRG